MKLRRINRGIALGCVLIIALTGYVIVDTFRFAKNQNTIESNVKNFFNTYSQVSTSASNTTQLIENYKNFINDNMVYEKMGGMNHIIKKSDFIQSLNSDISDICDYNPSGYINELSINIQDISISKYGSSGACATVDYNMIIDVVDNPVILTGYGLNTASYYYPYSEDDDSDEIKGHKRIAVSSCQDIIYLKLIDNKWEITGFDYSSGSFGDTKMLNSDNSSSQSDSESKDGDSSER
ncbi:MAG: hypothetical protein ACI4RC_05690 [Oscillospiraceae bacterium]